MHVDTRKGVHPWQFGLALLAVMTPVVPALAWVHDGFVVLPLFLGTAAVTAVPLLFHGRPGGFALAAWAVSLPLLAWSFLGALAGMFVFFPSVLQLWLASAADPRERPRAAGVMTGAGLVLSVLQVGRLMGG
ncbi:hypothetical protein ACFWWS_02505 [Streptomyces sp. NPDC059083]|uniref:hypothetical protein n=1 Tax=unclassified Streptomyces TaxID=2593676 RepID=UPI00369DA886